MMRTAKHEIVGIRGVLSHYGLRKANCYLGVVTGDQDLPGIAVEHVLAGVKRCRIVKDVFRNTKPLFDDLVMEIACGLHNARVAYRYAKP